MQKQYFWTKDNMFQKKRHLYYWSANLFERTVNFWMIFFFTGCQPETAILGSTFKRLFVGMKKKSFWTYKRSRSLSKSLSWGCLLCLLFRKSVDVVPWRWHIGVFWQNLVQKNQFYSKILQICCQYGPTFTKGGHKERAVYHLRERRFISTWCKHPIHLTFDNGRERQKIINRSLLHLLGSLPSFYS